MEKRVILDIWTLEAIHLLPRNVLTILPYPLIYNSYYSKYIVDCTLQKNKESQPALFLIQAFLNLKNPIFLLKKGH